MKTRQIFVHFIFIIALVVMFSCNKNESNDTSSKFGYEKEYKRGPITLVVKVDKKEISIAQKLTFIIEAILQEDYEIELPAFGKKLSQFSIKSYIEKNPRLIGKNKIKYEKKYILEPFLSGKYTIPPVKVLFWKKNKKQEKVYNISSKEITIKVNSILKEKSAKLTIKDITPPIEPTKRVDWLVYVFSIWGGVVLIICIIAYWQYRKSIKEYIAPRIPAHEIAFERIRILLQEKLIEKKQIKLFYNKISNILRHYIEDRFNLSAPEQTTEEFLRDLETSNILDKEYKIILKKFLSHCDLVKFAKHDPSNEEIQKTFDTCKNFISTTKIVGAV